MMITTMNYDYEDFDLANEEGRLPPFLGIILKNESSPHIENPSFIRIYEQVSLTNNDTDDLTNRCLED